MIARRLSLTMAICAMPGLAWGQPQPRAVDTAWFTGMWSDHQDCRDVVDFRPDGSFRTAEGGEGRWTLDGGLLTLAGVGGNQSLILRRVGPNQVSATNVATNATASSWRCKAEGSRDNRAERPVAASPPSTPRPALTREFLIGRWGLGGSCGDMIVTFAADGSASPPTGTRWQLNGNIVSVTQPGGQAEPATITVTGANSFRATPGDRGEAIAFVRCPAGD